MVKLEKEVEFMAENDMDLGNLKSRDVGNLISKTLVEMGKEEVQGDTPDGDVDYGNLPSRTLPEVGKQVIANKIKQEEATIK
jgi:hypothetical protein